MPAFSLFYRRRNWGPKKLSHLPRGNVFGKWPSWDLNPHSGALPATTLCRLPVETRIGLGAPRPQLCGAAAMTLSPEAQSLGLPAGRPSFSCRLAAQRRVVSPQTLLLLSASCRNLQTFPSVQRHSTCPSVPGVGTWAGEGDGPCPILRPAPQSSAVPAGRATVTH